jgi:hypothetical protein
LIASQGFDRLRVEQADESLGRGVRGTNRRRKGDQMQGKRTWRRKRAGFITVGVITSAMAFAATASANVPFQEIRSPGPISNLWVGNDLSCQAKLTQDEVYSYYPPAVAPGDCGTFVQVDPGPAVYAPDFDAHDGTAAANPVWTPWTPVSQTPVAGSGTASDPYTVTTSADAGTSGIRVSERYTYVSGQRSYNVDITVTNDNAGSRTVRLYHAIDCYLAGSDIGYGHFDPATGGVFCTETPNNSPAGRVLGFTPTSGSTRYIESFFATVWDETDGTDYPNTVEPDVFQDNGIGLQWTLTVPGAARSGRGAETVGFTGRVDSGDALETAITSGPKKKVKAKKKKKKATFQFAATLGGVPVTDASFTCQVDGRAPVPCTSPFTTKVKKGKHTFQVYASANGETDSSPAALQWKLKQKKKK